MSDSPLLTVPEAARFLRVNQRTVRRWCRDGQLPAARVGGVWRIDTSGQLQVTTGARGPRPVNGRIR